MAALDSTAVTSGGTNKTSFSLSSKARRTSVNAGRSLGLGDLEIMRSIMQIYKECSYKQITQTLLFMVHELPFCPQ